LLYTPRLPQGRENIGMEMESERIVGILILEIIHTLLSVTTLKQNQ
jgi:hypothetical protein